MKGYKAVSYTFGSGMKDQFAALALHRGHVDLQFPHGVDLSDPAGLLEGTGKSMRHVKIREEATVHREEVSKRRTFVTAHSIWRCVRSEPLPGHRGGLAASAWPRA